MPKRRDYRAEYAARAARAKARGYSGYREQRKARAGEGPAMRPGDTAGPRQIIPTGDGGWIARSQAGDRTMAARIRQADQENIRAGYGHNPGEGEQTGGGRLHIQATYDDGRTVDLTGKGGVNPATLLALLADEYGGDVDALVDDFDADVYGAGGGGGGVVVSYTIGWGGV